MSSVKITFWGVRGSMATPGPKTVHFGGNTACVEILSGNTRIICDGGTGIRPLGIHLEHTLGNKAIRAHILLTHLHWDHYIGLPFFKPLFSKNNHFVIGGPMAGNETFGEAISKAMRPPYFPIPFSAIPSSIEFKTYSGDTFKIGDVGVKPILVNHPGGALGWRFFFPNGKSLVHITDNEPSNATDDVRLIEWMKNADVLIHDAQYTPDNYAKHKGWGHSPYTYPMELAEKANVKKLFLFHFDPGDEDKHLKHILKEAKKFAKSSGKKVKIDLAREGVSIKL